MAALARERKGNLVNKGDEAGIEGEREEEATVSSSHPTQPHTPTPISQAEPLTDMGQSYNK